MAGLSAEVSDDLRDFSDSPAKEADEAENEREVVADVAETVLEILLHPTHAWLILHHAVCT